MHRYLIRSSFLRRRQKRQKLKLMERRQWFMWRRRCWIRHRHWSKSWRIRIISRHQSQSWIKIRINLCRSHCQRRSWWILNRRLVKSICIWTTQIRRIMKMNDIHIFIIYLEIKFKLIYNLIFYYFSNSIKKLLLKIFIFKKLLVF